jgi:hypothetical protein
LIGQLLCVIIVANAHIAAEAHHSAEPPERQDTRQRSAKFDG